MRRYLLSELTRSLLSGESVSRSNRKHSEVVGTVVNIQPIPCPLGATEGLGLVGSSLKAEDTSRPSYGFSYRIVALGPGTMVSPYKGDGSIILPLCKNAATFDACSTLMPTGPYPLGIVRERKRFFSDRRDRHRKYAIRTCTYRGNIIEPKLQQRMWHRQHCRNTKRRSYVNFNINVKIKERIDIVTG